MRAEYPNLPLIEEKFRNLFHDMLNDGFDFEVQVFKQTFPNTAGIFEDGGMSGQAFTDQYITVIYDHQKNIYGVYGGNQLAYALYDPNEIVQVDMQNRDMATLKHAFRRYRKAKRNEDNSWGETKR